MISTAPPLRRVNPLVYTYQLWHLKVNNISTDLSALKFKAKFKLTSNIGKIIKW